MEEVDLEIHIWEPNGHAIIESEFSGRETRREIGF